MSYRVVLGSAPASFGELAAMLEAENCEVKQLPENTGGWTPELIRDFAADAQALIGTFAATKLPRAVLEAAPNLHVVVSPIIGTEHIDVKAATELGIAVGYGATPENILGVAEAVVMLLAVWRKQFMTKYDTVRAGGWRSPVAGHMVRHSTVGLVGFGNIGRAVAKRLLGWECAVIATDPYIDPAVAPPLGVELVDLNTLLARSDTVVLLVTLTDETRHMIGRSELAKMKRGAYLINVARGGLVDEPELIEAINANQLSGAAIDTWEREPSPLGDPMRAHPRIIVTGHNIGHSDEGYASLPVAAVENAMRGLRGEPPLHFRNPEVLEKWRARLRYLGVNSAPF
jgi:D-3-phosphoglycerate dehydrogenase / 2-oxoglutarate reductase